MEKIDWLSHSSEEITKKYCVHSTLSEKDKVAETLEEKYKDLFK